MYAKIIQTKLVRYRFLDLKSKNVYRSKGTDHVLFKMSGMTCKIVNIFTFIVLSTDNMPEHSCVVFKYLLYRLYLHYIAYACDFLSAKMKQ